MADDDDAAIGHMLRVQHRMHERIMRFPSDRSYQGALVAAAEVAGHTLLDLLETTALDDSAPDDSARSDDPWFAPDRPFELIDTAGAGFAEDRPEDGESVRNPGEARLVERLVRRAHAAGLPPEQIGVITPYAAQRAVLSEALADLVDHGLEVDSVDGFQGREREFIVFSAVRSNDVGEVGFLADARRLNVALTRARRKLVVVCDSATVGQSPDFSALVEHAVQTEAYRSCFELPDAFDA